MQWCVANLIEAIRIETSRNKYHALFALARHRRKVKLLCFKPIMCRASLHQVVFSLSSSFLATKASLRLKSSAHLFAGNPAIRANPGTRAFDQVEKLTIRAE